jgi:uncharacterized protein (DUF2384 family)
MLSYFVDNAGSATLVGRILRTEVSAKSKPTRRARARYVRRLGLRQQTAWSASLSRGDPIITQDARFELQLNKARPSKETLDLLRNLLGFSDQELARALDVTTRSVHRWRAGGRISTESEERLFDLMRIVAALAELELPPANIRAWFFYRNPFLQEERPIDVFAKGRYTALRPAVDAIGDAAYT